MKYNHSCRFVTFCFVLFLVAHLTMLASCGNKSDQKTQQFASEAVAEETPASDSQEEKNADMKAPQIKADEAGLIGLSQCPQEFGSLNVTFNEDKTEAKIYKDGQLLQTITDEDGGLVAAGGDVPVYFMDANFDGWVDIFAGPGESRTYSTILLWDPAAEQFVRVGKLGTPSLQNIILCPEEKTIYEGGSNSWCSSSFTRDSWQGHQLVEDVELTIVTDAEQYGENGVTHRYTLRDSEQKEMQSTDDISQLPAAWANVLKKLGME